MAEAQGLDLTTQTIFRHAMMALARPGDIHTLPEVSAPAGLPMGLAALALTLCDFETPVWFDAPLAADTEVTDWLRFHTGARVVANPAHALFAFATSLHTLPPLTDFAWGTDTHPDRSTTLVVAVETLTQGPLLTLAGPGIPAQAHLHISPLPGAFVAARSNLTAQFPRGVDIFFTCGRALAALPRSTHITCEA